MKRLVFVVMLALLPSMTSASHMSHLHWGDGKSITVRDYTNSDLDGYVEIITRNWQAALGTGGLTLTYEREAATPCADIVRLNGSIDVCSAKSDEAVGGDTAGTGITDIHCATSNNCTGGDGSDKRIVYARVYLVSNDWTGPPNTVGYWWHPLGCHEMGHALGLNHYYTDYSEHHTCMGTQGQSPGDHDVASMKNQYGGRGGVSVFQTCCEQVRLVAP